MSDVMVLQRLDDLERRVGRLEVITREFPGEADVAIELKHSEPRGTAFSPVRPGTTGSAAPTGATISPVSPGAGIEARAVAESVEALPPAAATPLPIPAAADPDFAVAASVAKTPEVAPLTTPPKPGADPIQDQHNPTVLFNGMIAPVVPMLAAKASSGPASAMARSHDRSTMWIEIPAAW